MTRVLATDVSVSYAQAYVEQAGRYMSSMEATLAGQANGLCGAADPGILFLVTGLHTGVVPFVIEVHQEEPPLSEDFEDVVEVSFEAFGTEISLNGWGGESSAPFTLVPGVYRVRYSANGMDAGHQVSCRFEDEPAVDSYRLQFWPAPTRPDTVVRQTSSQAHFWHEHATSLPAPPTSEEKAAAARALADRIRIQNAEQEATEDLYRWAGRLPSARLRACTGNVTAVAQSDRDLLDEFDTLQEQTQRSAALWLARRAFEFAGLTERPWAAAALTAAEAHRPLPPPFGDLGEAFTHLHQEEGAGAGHWVSYQGPDEIEPKAIIHRPSFALPVLMAAIDHNPLNALVNAYSHTSALFEAQSGTLLAELRLRFLGK